MPLQEAFTVVADIRPDRRDSLERLLKDMGADPAGNSLVPFGALPDVHFARFLVLPESTDLKGKSIPAKLVLSTNVDGSVLSHLHRLLETVAHGFDQVFGHCAGYPAGPAIDRSQRAAFFRQRMVRANAFYVNTVGRTLQQVRQEEHLRRALQDMVDSESKRHGFAGMTPSSIHAFLRRHARETPHLRWALSPAQGLSLPTRFTRLVRKIARPFVFAAVGLVSLPLLPFYVVGLRFKEMTDVPDTTRPTLEHVQRVSAGEDLYVQNPFSGVGYIKPGLIRGVTVRVALRLLDYASKYIYNSGTLTGVTTIHFARWVIIDNGRRTLFLSNYDGSLESYMSDFIDMVAWGLNLVFSNGVGWPRTSWLIKGGAEREMDFKNFLRSHQLATQVYYSAYPDLTAVNIANNAAIRKGLTVDSMTDVQAEEWLRRL